MAYQYDIIKMEDGDMLLLFDKNHVPFAGIYYKETKPRYRLYGTHFQPIAQNWSKNNITLLFQMEGFQLQIHNCHTDSPSIETSNGFGTRFSCLGGIEYKGKTELEGGSKYKLILDAVNSLQTRLDKIEQTVFKLEDKFDILIDRLDNWNHKSK
jgi:hypothetical protein